MTREEKTAAIEELKEKFSENSFFYLTDSSSLPVDTINKLRRKMYENGIEMRVVKNTLVKKALEAAPAEKRYSEIIEALSGPTTVLFTKVPNLPARLIDEFRKNSEKPALKAAYIDSAVYVGDDQLKALASLKSKEELLGELIGLLQSPMSNLVNALNSGGQTIMGLLKTLEERD